ncbi:hypothetical protein [Candidatus Cardinium sp. cBcalN1]|nr:hypothetical protein [Candidatus Cardinium sp. cBcalN1]
MTKNKIIKDRLNCFITKYSNIKGSYRRFVWLLSICLLSGCSGIKTINGVNEQSENESKLYQVKHRNFTNYGNNQPKQLLTDQHNTAKPTTPEGAKSSSNQSYTSDGIWKNIGITCIGSLVAYYAPLPMPINLLYGGVASAALAGLSSETGAKLLAATYQKIYNTGQCIYECCKAYPEACSKTVLAILVGAGIGLSGTIGYAAYNSLTSNQEELYSLAKQDCGFIEKIGGDPDKIGSAQFKEFVEAIIKQSDGNFTKLIDNCKWSTTKYLQLMDTSNSMVGPNDVALN